MIAAAMVVLARLITGATPRWVGCVPDTRQRIYFANHTSHLDALIIWSVLPPLLRDRTRPVAAKDYWTAGPLRRRLAEQIFHAVLIERKKPTTANNPLTEMLAALDKQDSLIVFPEGTRGFGPEPGPFKAGLFHLAKHRPDLELVPVRLENLNRILPRGEFLPLPLLGGVSFGIPVQLKPGEEKAQFLERARQSVIELRL